MDEITPMVTTVQINGDAIGDGAIAAGRDINFYNYDQKKQDELEQRVADLVALLKN